ncbi:MAG: hypothetical protein M0Q90_03385 [Bacteroidales bacterium]|nr:hypothetical protein [Bacteroidales bacterium]
MKKLILILALFLIVATSCKKDNKIDDIQIGDKSMLDLTIDAQFDWKTTKSIQVVLRSSTSNTVYIQSEEGDIYLKAFLKAGENLSTNITIPSYKEEVLLLFNRQNIKVSVAGNNLSYSFN